ncbi:MAG TPA: hypothetical protein VLX44_12580 [Xanthobacteraceae bacterium]|nr:hypothetical protein [Xanthobacteraceae bacterium]
MGRASRGREIASMWVIVAVTLGLTGDPKLTVVSGAAYKTEQDCVRATKVHADFDADHRDIAFSFCMRKDSVQIGPPASSDPGKSQAQ